MSYNISHWDTLELKDFSIPLTAFDNEDDEVDYGDDLKSATVSLAENSEINGTLNAGLLEVKEIYFGGEASAWALERLRVIAPQTTGYLDAVLIWEGGDSVSRLTIKDGVFLNAGFDLPEVIRFAIRKLNEIQLS